MIRTIAILLATFGLHATAVAQIAVTPGAMAQRVDKIITDANAAENAMQRVMAEAKRLKADLVTTAVPVVTPPVVAPPPVAHHPVSTGQVDITSPSLAGLRLLVPHDPETDLEPSWGSGAIAADNGSDPVGAFRQVVGPGFAAKADPILYPCQPGMGHLHEFSGALTTDIACATPERVIAEPIDSTANRTRQAHSSQKSIYWIPALMNGKGQRVGPDFNRLYYKRTPKSDPMCGMPNDRGSGPSGICIPEPNGLRMIAGIDPHSGIASPKNIRTDLGGNPVHYTCVEGGSGKAANIPQLAALAPGCKQLEIVVDFPNCWTGTHLWKVDRSHVVYQVNHNTDGRFRCPASNPYAITGISIHFAYTLDADWKTYRLSCDGMLPNAAAGTCLHSDAMIIWDERVKAMREAGCIEGHKNCSGGDLGNGKQLKGAAEPAYLIDGKWVQSFKNPSRLTLAPAN